MRFATRFGLALGLAAVLCAGPVLAQKQGVTLTVNPVTADHGVKLDEMLGFGSAAAASVAANSGGTLGWTQLTGTRFSTVAPSYPEIQGQSSGTNAGVFEDWTSGAIDFGSYNRQATKFIHTGGGHADYDGNEVYGLNLLGTPATSLAKDATHNPVYACSGEQQLIATPTARHIYNGFLYNPHRDWYFLYGNYLGCAGGAGGTDRMWVLDPNTATFNGNDPTGWTLLAQPATHPNHAVNGSDPQFAYSWGDETHQPFTIEIEANTTAIFTYNDVSNTWTHAADASPSATCTSKTNLTVAIDQIARVYYCIGQGAFYKMLIDSPYTTTHLAGSGCSALISAQAPGFTWYGPMRKFVGWLGGNTAYVYDPTTDSCTTQTFSGGPTTVQALNGTFGDFQYVAALGVFVSCNSIGEDCFELRLDTNAALQAADWNRRSTAAGVVTARGWDNASDFTTQGGNTNGIHVSVSNGSVMTRDLTTYASGGSSMKCVIPAQTGADACGAWWEFLTHTFVNGETMYVQFRQKFDANALNQHPKAGDGSTTYFKQAIFANTQVSGGSPSTCGNPELTTINDNDRGYPLMYTNCGSARNPDPLVEVSLSGGTDFLKEQGDNSADLGAAANTGFNCHFQTGNNNAKSCANYPAGVWVTYYYKVQIGAFGSANSTIQAWRALPGQPYQQWAKVSGFLLNIDSGTVNGYNFVDLLNYYTNRNGSLAFGQTGATWYDELIVSTQPIAPPLAPVN